MKKSILLTHQFIDIDEEYKMDIIDLCVSHYRINNPNDFIVITGHGVLPYSKTLDKCDEFFWSPKILPSEINLGHPKLVNIGIDILQKNGFTNFCKSRIDSIMMFSSIADYCDKVIVNENSKMLITTSNNHAYLLGDLFLYGDLNFIKTCWEIDTWYPTNSGLESLGKNFIIALGGKPTSNWSKDTKLVNNKTWHELLIENTSYRDPKTLKWIDLRKNWREIMSFKNYREKLFNNDFPFERFIWDAWPNSIEFHPYTEEIFYKKV